MALHDSPENERDHYLTEALGAFAHEIRTPLTSLRMVVELARRQGDGNGTLIVEPELAAMLNQSLDDLQQLADDIQETSRLERKKIIPVRGSCDLPAAVEAARLLLQPRIVLEGPPPPVVAGPWDEARLVRAIAGFAESANRIGEGSGAVRLEGSAGSEGVSLTFASGNPTGEERPIAADAGFAFFRSRQYVLAVGGTLEARRGDHFAHFTARLPLAGPGGGYD